MGKKAVIVEFFFTGGCSNCAKARETLREVAESTPHVEWKEVDIGKNPHRAVDVGIVSTPAVTIDRKLVFKAMPSAPDLRSAIEASVRERFSWT